MLNSEHSLYGVQGVECRSRNLLGQLRHFILLSGPVMVNPGGDYFLNVSSCY
ncbi:MAG: hypothetical protein QF832_05315 [SAR324 cluster bacterium]|nr:hypothetical protein [SAR324 cluster bacterium]